VETYLPACLEHEDAVVVLFFIDELEFDRDVGVLAIVELILDVVVVEKVDVE
jgi:hypothetical protein